jgi:hypothetical protein
VHKYQQPQSYHAPKQVSASHFLVAFLLVIKVASKALDGWLARGYAVVAPDYQGLGTPGGHPYIPEGAQVSATPVVPCAQASIGQPFFGGVPFGNKIKADATKLQIWVSKL